MNIAEFLKKEKDARKIFGRREITIIEKQINGLNLTQSEKNRLSRDIRKKLEVVEKLNRYSSEFQLKKGEAIKELIDETLQVIKKNPLLSKIKRIVLFGSTLEKARHLNSDIDMAVEFSEINQKEATQFIIKVAGSVNDKMDIQVYNILPNKMKEEVDKKGKIIYKKDEKNR